VRMEGLENGFARNASGERGDGGEDGFRHDDCDAFVMVCAMLREDGGEGSWERTAFGEEGRLALHGLHQ
jgi:hypothetical protein